MQAALWHRGWIVNHEKIQRLMRGLTLTVRCTYASLG